MIDNDIENNNWNEKLRCVSQQLIALLVQLGSVMSHETGFSKTKNAEEVYQKREEEEEEGEA